MSEVFTPSAQDLEFYQSELESFFPHQIFDIHSHLCQPGSLQNISAERRRRYWMLNLPIEQSTQEYLAAYQAILPRKKVRSLAFAFPILEANLAAQNEYVLAAARQHPTAIYPLYVATPETSEADLEQALSKGFLGFKPYPDLFVGDHPGEESIFEFLTHRICRVAQRWGAIVMLHISRARRLADERNIAELFELMEKYPRIRLIVAHLGRSYNPFYLERGLELMQGHCPWVFDFSAVTNQKVFELALSRIPCERICFGFDNPLMLSRGYYEFPAPDQYKVHIVGYNLAEPNHLPLAWQTLKGFKQAAIATRLSSGNLNKIFYENAHGLIQGAVADHAMVIGG